MKYAHSLSTLETVGGLGFLSSAKNVSLIPDAGWTAVPCWRLCLVGAARQLLLVFWSSQSAQAERPCRYELLCSQHVMVESTCDVHGFYSIKAHTTLARTTSGKFDLVLLVHAIFSFGGLGAACPPARTPAHSSPDRPSAHGIVRHSACAIC